MSWEKTLEGETVLNKINVAIDGPAGSGKSTVVRLVADQLGYVYVDTGAMYRAVTWMVIQRGLAPERQEEIIKLAGGLDIRLIPGPQGQQVWVNDQNVTEAIRSPQVSRLVPVIAQIPEVRSQLVKKQKEKAAGKGVVMDGRDIGTRVMPDAEVKIFLTASAKERARRRYEELKEKGENVTLRQLEMEIEQRDRIDREREVSPLAQAEDAILIDSTDLTAPEVVQTIVNLCRNQIGEES